MKKIAFLAVAGVFLTVQAFSQKGYISSNDHYSAGFLVDAPRVRNQVVIEFKTRQVDEYREYYAKDLTEYGFFNGDEYVSKKINHKGVLSDYFLLRHVKGDRQLFEFKPGKGKRFFIEDQSGFNELDRKTYREQINALVGPMESLSLYPSALKFNAVSMARVISLRNQNYEGLWPTWRAGLLAGYSQNSITLINRLGARVSGGTDSSPFIGIFMESPIGLKTMWFVRIETLFQKNSFSNSNLVLDTKLDYLVNMSTVSIPLLIRYRSTNKIFRPFIEVGPTMGFNLTRESVMFQVYNNGSVIQTDKYILNSISPYQISGMVGAGAEYSFVAKMAASLGLRYSYGGGFGQTSNHTISALQLVAGISLR